MSFATLKSAVIGQPIRRGGVSLFPVYFESSKRSGAAVADDSLMVSELESASVPQLQVTNLKDTPVIIPAGRVLEGGRQTRTVNVSILVPAGATLTIPVSCVEAGRWHGGSHFRDSKRVAGRNVRMAKQRGVKSSIDRHLGKYSDQGAVWNSISFELQSRSIEHESSNYLAADHYVEQDRRRSEMLNEFLNVGLEPGQTGVAVAYGNAVAGVEVFTSVNDLVQSWETLVRSAVLDAPEGLTEDVTVDIAAVETFLAEIASQEASVAGGTGLGVEYHVANERVVAHALLDDDGELMHAYAFAEI